MMSRLVRGTAAGVVRGLRATCGSQVVSTAYIERLNATFRSRLGCLARRTRGLARHTDLSDDLVDTGLSRSSATPVLS